MRKRKKDDLGQGTADGHKQSRLQQVKNEQPSIFMQVYQLFFVPLPKIKGDSMNLNHPSYFANS